LEIKKSHNADLEHRRPMFFAIALVGVIAVFALVLFFPYKSIGEMMEESFDDYSMDLDFKANSQDDMISAALPKEEKIDKESNQLNKVDETQELAPEDIDPVKTEEEEKQEEQQEEEEKEAPINLNDAETLKIVEQLPEYPGGMVEFMKWLTAMLKYPDAALKRKIEGKVMVSFIVNADGSISDIKLVQGAHKLLDDEALRVVRLMPKWKPGLEGGRPCRTMISIPIVFEI
jgi:protein TonB